MPKEGEGPWICDDSILAFLGKMAKTLIGKKKQKLYSSFYTQCSFFKWVILNQQIIYRFFGNMQTSLD
jgi:hypothetical protein